MGEPALIKVGERYSYADYLQWPVRERWELIDGVPYDMSPAPSRWHQEISGYVFSALYHFLRDKACKVYSAPFDVRLKDLDDDSDDKVFSVVQPDVSVICDAEKLDDRGCVGAPDLIVEILSESTAGKDLRDKLSLYERHGVREYWIIDPWSHLLTVHSLGANGAFEAPVTYARHEKAPVNVLSGFEIDLRDMFALIPKGAKA